MIEIIQPENEAAWLEMRKADITSTAVSSLFGANPYMSRRELWEQKRNNFTVEFKENEKMKWGNALQDTIAHTVAKEQGWNVRKMTEYIRNSKLRLGASFDFAIGEDGIQEIKTVGEEAFRKGWLERDGNIEAPVNYEFQVQLQLMLSGRKYAYLCALVGGQRLVTLKREPNHEVFSAIEREAASFWKSVEDNNPPPFEFPKDNALVSALYGYAEPGRVMEGNRDIDELASVYRQASDAVAKWTKVKEQTKSQILVKIGSAEKVKGSNYTISAGLVAEAEVAYTRKPYRNFRLFFRGSNDNDE